MRTAVSLGERGGVLCVCVCMCVCVCAGVKWNEIIGGIAKCANSGEWRGFFFFVCACVCVYVCVCVCVCVLKRMK